MTQSFDQFPVYDPIIEYGTNRMSPIWRDFMATFYDNLTGYLGPFGNQLPPLTTAQRDSIQNPQNGQYIYNTTLSTAQYFKNGVWVNF